MTDELHDLDRSGGPDGDETAAVVPVDGAEVERRPGRLERAGSERRKPVVPGWVRSRPELRARAWWAAGFSAHTLAYHAVRLPLYGWRLAVRAPAGAGYGARELLRWLTDAEGAPARRAAVAANDGPQYLKLSAQRDTRVQARFLAAVFAVPVGLWVFWSVPPAVRLLLLAVAVGVAGWVGSPADRPLVGRAVVTNQPPRLTSDLVVRALGALGIGELNKALARGADREMFPAPITRDGPGWRAEVNLPYGVTVAEIVDKRDKLASGLRRPLACVWPEPDSEQHAGRLILWVADKPLSQTKAPGWPLAVKGIADLFAPVPFGTDQRGRPVTVTLMFASMVIGAIPRMGKTFAARLLALACALDVRCELHLFDLKGTGDFSALEPVAHRYRAGDDDDDIAYVLAGLRELQAELRRRTKVLRGLPRDVCPESKITPELAGRRSLRLHPIAVFIDECQRLFEHPTYGAELQAISEDLVRRGPAVGIVAVFATQRPDARSLPTGISGNAVLRFCLKVMDQIANDQVLGTSAYKAGVRATLFSRRDLGTGILAGEGDDPQITRTYFVDNPGAGRVITRARQLRQAAGTLSGHALGEQPAAVSVSLLDDILAVVPAAEERVWSETVTERLADLRPDTYAGWGPEQLAAALKPHGIDTDQIGRRVDGRIVNRRGITRAHLQTAVTARNRDQP